MSKPQELIRSDDIERQNFKKLVTHSSWIIALFAGGSIFIYIARFASNGLGSTAEFAQFGDFLGGVLSPILTFITILLLVWSIKVQMKELALTRVELKKSSEALEATEKTHSETLQLHRKENIRKQIDDDFKNKIRTIESLLDKPLFPFYHPAQTGKLSHTLHSFNQLEPLLEQPRTKKAAEIFIDGSDPMLEFGQKENISATKVLITRNITYIQECILELYEYLDNYYVALSSFTQVEDLVTKCMHLNILSAESFNEILESIQIPARLLDKAASGKQADVSSTETV